MKSFSNSVSYNCPQGRKEEMNMIKSTTFEEIFKTIEENNNLFEKLGRAPSNKTSLMIFLKKTNEIDN